MSKLKITYDVCGVPLRDIEYFCEHTAVITIEKIEKTFKVSKEKAENIYDWLEMEGEV